MCQDHIDPSDSSDLWASAQSIGERVLNAEHAALLPSEHSQPSLPADFRSFNLRVIC